MSTKKSSLSNRALLVNVTVSKWTGRKLDKRATDQVNSTNRAESGVGNYHKKLLPKSKELEKITSIDSKIRKFFYEQTLPWMTDGTRILSSKNYLKFQSDFQKLQSDFDIAVKEFVLVYPQLKLDAQKSLGDLYNLDDYPATIADKFKVGVDFYPLPDVSDFRIDLSESEKIRFTQKIKETEAKALTDASNRLLDVIKSATSKLRETKSIFRDSLLTNIAEVADLLPMLNINDDPQLDKLSQEARDLVNGIDLDEVREDSTKRLEAHDALKELESKLGAFMGGVK